jgi:hypothetical protein
MRYTLVGDLIKHQYVYVDSRFTHKQPEGFIPAVWFGVVSFPGRAWGCNLLLESGAIYRNIPLHALAFSASPEPIVWSEVGSQTWDCYGYDFTLIEYRYLAGLRCKAKTKQGDFAGSYLFTAAPIGDGFSENVEQSKEFTFVRLENDRITVQPTNNLVFEERSFTTNKDMAWPTGLKRQTEVYTAE